MKREPVAIINAVVTAIQASIPLLLLLAFGIAHMTLPQAEVAAISSAVVAWVGLLGTLLSRNLVTPVAYPKDHEGRLLGADQLDQPRNAPHQQLRSRRNERGPHRQVYAVDETVTTSPERA